MCDHKTNPIPIVIRNCAVSSIHEVTMAAYRHTGCDQDPE